eukprot:PhM_4_TR13999/c0_g1_i1/m.24510
MRLSCFFSALASASWWSCKSTEYTLCLFAMGMAGATVIRSPRLYPFLTLFDVLTHIGVALFFGLLIYSRGQEDGALNEMPRLVVGEESLGGTVATYVWVTLEVILVTKNIAALGVSVWALMEKRELRKQCNIDLNNNNNNNDNNGTEGVVETNQDAVNNKVSDVWTEAVEETIQMESQTQSKSKTRKDSATTATAAVASPRSNPIDVVFNLKLENYLAMYPLKV